MRILASACLFACLAAAQSAPTGPIVSLNPAGPPIAVSALNFYTGTSIVYRCQAVSVQPTYSWTYAGSTLTSIVVATNVATATTSTAHGLAVGNRVTVSGSSTSAVNGTFVIATVPSSTTFTYSDTVANGTYTTGITLSTTAPRSTAAIWSIKYFQYDGSSNLTNEQWAEGQTDMTRQCSSRANYAYQ